MTTEPFEPVAPEPDTVRQSEPGPEDAPSAPPPTRRPTRAGRRAISPRMLVNAVLGIAFVVLVGGVGFAVGRATTPASTAAGGGGGPALQAGLGFPGTQDEAGQLGGPGDGARDVLGGSRSVQGTVVSISGSTLTLKLADGQTLDLAITSATGYHRQADATSADVAAGNRVIVDVTGMGPGSQAASATAGSITIVP